MNGVIKASADRKISSYLFTFRLVSRSWAVAGMNLFLDVARTNRYSHYLVVNLPPPGRHNLLDLAKMFEMQPRLAPFFTEVVVHLIPEYLPGSNYTGHGRNPDKNSWPDTDTGRIHVQIGNDIARTTLGP